MTVYDVKTTKRKTQEALLHAAQLLGFQGPGIYDEAIYQGGGRELVETPAEYIEMLRQSIEISYEVVGRKDYQVKHRVRFVGIECARCEAEPVSKNHSDLCDACWALEEKPKRGLVVFSGKVKDLATADLSGGWKGPGNYEVSVEGLPRVIRCESMCDLVSVLSESPGALVRFVGGD
tara:strand:- start:167 stop:697 length:531 start_codon:yes stop_codon:yes gene_type:complete